MSAAGSPGAAPQFAALLREWRRRRRYSQLALSLASGVSQRHLSQLENARARPGAALVLRLAEAMELPLAARDALLAAAGYAPLSPSARPGPAPPQLIARALSLVLRASEPFPAVVLDAAWNVHQANRPFQHLVHTLAGGRAPSAATLNLLRASFDPAGLRPFIVNWDEVARSAWQRAQREFAASGSPALGELLDDLARNGWVPGETAADAPLLPVIPLILRAPGGDLTFVSIVSTYGTPQDSLAEELRVETFYPADAATDQALRQLDGGCTAEGVSAS